ncbi:MAG: MBL fold metallo-hydrolase [Firmicutes bacterium]|nr:MBL fold metallo-hydrolase [Bacillota bacterium]
MSIKRYESDLLLSNMYVVTEGQHAIVIDPCRDTAAGRGLIIDKIILTHEHYDHVSGVNMWKEFCGAPVLCSQICAEHIRNPAKSLAKYFKEFCELQTWIKLDSIPDFDPDYSCLADETFSDTMSFSWEGHVWDLFEIPGHSLGSIGILLDKQFFFSGDSLLEKSKIELKAPGGSRKKWEETGSKRIERLPSGIRVFPGHFNDFVHRIII